MSEILREPMAPCPTKARYLMIGGFLGAGKTTAVARLARCLSDRGLRVGLITNDQGSHLVDTTLLESRGFPVEEIAGGCFCCRFNSLLDAARKLSAASRPDIFIAEPVGSCTDLVATVTYPLRRIYGDNFLVAPLSVLVDAVRAQRVFGLAEGGKFSEKVLYIYRKQLEEADIIVINKVDLLNAAQLEALREALRGAFPQAQLREVCARDGRGLESWFDYIASAEQTVRHTMPVDYEVYAEGEALLGWLNATVGLQAAAPTDGNGILRTLAAQIHGRLNAAAAEVAHFKMTLDPHNSFGDVGVINLVRSDGQPELSQALTDPIETAQLVINIRSEASPETLRDAVVAGLQAAGAERGDVRFELEHSEYFRPGKPQPTHRINVG